MKPTIHKGGIHQDERGTLQFFNEFDMSKVKRMYHTTHADTETIRAWMGHKIEARWFFCTCGRFKVKTVAIDFNTLSPAGEVQECILSVENAEVLHIPAGFASGFQALSPSSSLLIMSDYHFGEVDDSYKLSTDEFLEWTQS
ncbi:dTDP-4-dehydrorhamnose 3,5-epimerase family protein [Flavobacteriaceae bacterium TK19130]|nr:dTDP-4-dehydrorhamnose 3,5-epimerase family protein [Thermobacterium salinum]